MLVPLSPPEVVPATFPAAEPDDVAETDRARSRARYTKTLGERHVAARKATRARAAFERLRTAYAEFRTRHRAFIGLGVGAVLIYVLIGLGIPLAVFALDYFILAAGSRYVMGLAGLVGTQPGALLNPAQHPGWLALLKLVVPFFLVLWEIGICAGLVAARAERRPRQPTLGERWRVWKWHLIGLGTLVFAVALTVSTVAKALAVRAALAAEASTPGVSSSLADNGLLVALGVLAIALHASVLFSERFGHNGRAWALFVMGDLRHRAALALVERRADREETALLAARDAHREAVDDFNRHDRRPGEPALEEGPLDPVTAAALNAAQRIEPVPLTSATEQPPAPPPVEAPPVADLHAGDGFAGTPAAPPTSVASAAPAPDADIWRRNAEGEIAP